MSTLFPFAETVARWILRHDRKFQRELAVIRNAAGVAEKLRDHEPMQHPERYPDMATLTAAQEAWKVNCERADDAVFALMPRPLTIPGPRVNHFPP